MLQTSKFQPLLERNFWVEKREKAELQVDEHIYKSSFQICGGKVVD